MTPYQLRQFKRAFGRFWKEWGMTKNEFFSLLTCISMFAGIMIFSAVMTIIF